ncbi:MAG: ABC transporter substrate-binding protein [Anaerolineae bacterium]
MSTLHIQLLGDCHLVHDGEPVTSVNTPRLQSLLAYLVLHREAPQSRQHLAFLLWPDSTEAQARTNLRKQLHHLRRALPDADRFLHTDTQTAQWRPDASFDLDVAAFESAIARAEQAEQAGDPTAVRAALEEAVGLYSGDLLPSCYDDWMLPQRERLSQTFIRTLERLSRHLEGQLDYGGAIGCAQRLLRHAPLHEAAYQRLMRLYALNGDRAGALRAYHTCTTVLQRELGAEPSPAIREAYERLLKVEASPIPPSTTLFALSPLVGRDQEWAQLQAAWQAAARGRPHLVSVTGEAGIGKTRLAEELIEWARRQGIATARTRSYAAEGGLAYAPVAAWLRTDPLRVALPALGDVWLTEVARLLPELLAERSGLTPPGPLTESWQRQRLFEALARATLASSQPLLLVIDDLQWCDRETLEWLHYLLRFDRRARLLIVGTYRPEETGPDHPLTSLLLALRRSRRLTEIELGPLDETETASLAAHVAGRELPPALAAQLYRETEGNPLFVVETVRAVAGDWRLEIGDQRVVTNTQSSISNLQSLPPGVQAVIEARLAQLSPSARKLADLAATIGREFTFEALAKAGDWGEDALVRGLDELWQRRVVREQGMYAYDFSHDKIRQVIYEGLSRQRRAHLHRKVALALEELYQERSGEIVAKSPVSAQSPVAAQLADHYAKAGEGVQAVEYLLQAGDRARGLYAHQEAIDHYQRALAFLKEQGEHEQAARTLMKLGLTYHGAFDFQGAHRAYEEGFALWQRAGDIMLAGRLPPARQALRVSWRQPQTLDPAMCMDIFSGGLIDQLFSGLVEPGPAMDVVPAVARTWEVLEGGSKYVFHLRDDVVWSDGTPVTAGDFEYAWKRVLDPATGAPYAHYLYDIKGARAFHQGEVSDRDSVAVRALDERTLMVELEGPVGHFLQILAQFLAYPVPRHVVEVCGEAWTDVEASSVGPTEPGIVTNGPFRLEAWQPGRSFVLSRNPAYHGRFSGNVQRVEVSLCVQWSYGAEVVEMYEADDLDMLASYMNAPLGVKLRHAGEYVTGPWPGTLFLGFDVRRPPFDDPRVRRAFALATDQETLANVVMGGHVYPGTDGFLSPGMPGHSAGIGLPYDPAGAQQLLAEAGYPGGEGFPAKCLHTSCDRAYVSESLRAGWREVLGIEMAGEELEWPRFLDRLNNDAPSVFLLGFPAFYPDPDCFLRASFFRRYTGWHSETYVELVEQARRATDQRERMAMYQQADRTLIQEAVIIPLAYARLHLLVKPWVKRLPTSWNKWWFWKDVIIEPH